MRNPEAAFIALCTRESDVVTDAEIRETWGQIRDWNEVVELAARHRALAYVRQALSRLALRMSLGSERSLGAHLMRVGTHAVLLQYYVQGIAERLVAENVPLLVLKGPVLGPFLYPSAVFRPFADLDIEVRLEHVDTAVAALRAIGLIEHDFDPEVARREHAGHVHGSSAFHRVFYSADGRVMVELHVDALQLGVRFSPEEARWARAVPAPAQPGVLMLCIPDQLVHLSVHAQKHGFNRLIWLKDLDLLLRTGNELDWRQAVEIARAEGVAASVWYTLTLVRDMLGTPIPNTLIEALRPALPVRIMYRCVWPTRKIIALQGHMRRRAVQFHVADSWQGMLPSLMLMGHRRHRLKAIADAVLR